MYKKNIFIVFLSLIFVLILNIILKANYSKDIIDQITITFYGHVLKEVKE